MRAALRCPLTSSLPACAQLVGVLVAVLAMLGVTASTARPAQAMTSASLARSVLIEASRHDGAPYQYGATGPSRFDCSGFTGFVYARVGRRLPRTAAGQYLAVQHVPRTAKRAGDLIFMTSGGVVYHVGLYAGGGRMWDAPRSGGHVRLRAIYSASYVVGRP